jgi:hypothetical protein
MIRRMLGQLAGSILAGMANHMPQARIIWDRSGTSPYLSRFYITKRPTMPDGSEPFDEYGDPKKGVRWPEEKIGLYLHHFHRSDDDQELHSHPWEWALSFVIAGGYTEERRVPRDKRDPLSPWTVITRTVKPFSFNFIRQSDYHRVDLLEEDAWSLFLVGPKTHTWYFWNRKTFQRTPWREFIEQAAARAMS